MLGDPMLGEVEGEATKLKSASRLQGALALVAGLLTGLTIGLGWGGRLLVLFGGDVTTIAKCTRVGWGCTVDENVLLSGLRGEIDFDRLHYKKRN